MRRFVVESKLKDQIDIFYEYTIQAGDRPDVIAEKYYGDANLAWLVLHFNDITDPFFGWGLNDVDLENYIRGKYGSIPAAQAEVHEYRQVLNESQTFFDGTVVPKRYVVVDQTTYNSLPESSRESISKFEYEIEHNDKKRQIKILDKRYVDQVIAEVKTILKDGI
jgi:hypothetical protein